MDAAGWRAMLSPVAGYGASLVLYRLSVPCDRMFNPSQYDGRGYRRLAFEDVLLYAKVHNYESHITGVDSSAIVSATPPLADITATWTRWFASSEDLVYDCPLPEGNGASIGRGLIAALEVKPPPRLPRSVRLMWCGMQGNLPDDTPADARPTLGRFLAAFARTARTDPDRSVKLSLGLVDVNDSGRTVAYIPVVGLDELEVCFPIMCLRTKGSAFNPTEVFSERTKQMFDQIGCVLPPKGGDPESIPALRRLVLRFRLTGTLWR